MQESKEPGWDCETVDETPPDRESPAHPADSAGEDGWQQYRRWISKAPAPPRTRRSGIDPSLYTWKGYRSWAKQVKRNWSDS